MRYFILFFEISLVVFFFLFRNSSYLEDAALDLSWLQTLGKFLIYLVLLDAVRRVARLWYGRKYRHLRGEKTNFDYGINNIAKVLAFLGGGVYLFQLFGVDIRTLLTSVSIVAAAIAIITKEYINDFLVGLYFSFSRNFEINDYVKVGEHKGKITELQILKLRLLNDDDDSVLIPNTKVYNSEIINYTRRDIRLMSIDFELNINSVQTIELLEEELMRSLTDFMEFIEEGSFNLRIVEIKKDLVQLKFQYSLKKFDRDTQRLIRKKTVRQVFNHIAGKTLPVKE